MVLVNIHTVFRPASILKNAPTYKNRQMEYTEVFESCSRLVELLKSRLDTVFTHTICMQVSILLYLFDQLYSCPLKAPNVAQLACDSLHRLNEDLVVQPITKICQCQSCQKTSRYQHRLGCQGNHCG